MCLKDQATLARAVGIERNSCRSESPSLSENNPMTPCLCDPKGCGFEVRMKSHSKGKRNKLLWKAGLQLKEAFLSKVPVPHLQQWNELSSWSCFSPKSVFPFWRAGTHAKISHRFVWVLFPFLGERHTIQNHLILEAMFGNRNFKSTVMALNQSLSLPGITRCCSHCLDILDLSWLVLGAGWAGLSCDKGICLLPV